MRYVFVQGTISSRPRTKEKMLTHSRGNGVFYKEIPYKLACVNGRSTIDVYFRVKDAYRLFAAQGAPFRPAKTPFEALSIMKKEMASEFDQDLFRAFIMLLGPGK